MNSEIYKEEIKQLLNKFVQEAHAQNLKGDANWTYEIKKRLAELGKKHQYNISVGGFRDLYEPEWLYDLVWYKEEGEGETARLIEIPLIMESEWNLHFDYIKYDFEKLLVSNAPLRLMICQCSEINRQNRIDYFRDSIMRYKSGNKDDIFLIALLDYESEEFHFVEIKK